MTAGIVISAPKILCLDSVGTIAKWVGIYKGRIIAIGAGEPPEVGQVIRRDGVVLPGLIDSHFHLTNTGLYRLGLDLRDCRSVPQLTTMLGEFLQSGSGNWIVAGNFDPGRNADARMPTLSEIDAVSGNRAILVSRTDGHSCTVNTAALEMIQLDLELRGIEKDSEGNPTGILSNVANYEARRQFFSRLPYGEVRKAQMAGCEAALERGITSIHEMGGASPQDFEVLMSWRDEYPVNIRPYLSTTDIGIVSRAGLDCIGGDFFLDGSIGSRTAALTSPYDDGPGMGTLYRSDEEIIDFFVSASRAGLQAAVHAIGDGAISQAIHCIEEAFLRLGPEGSVGARQLRHRIEHFECSSPDQFERARALGVIASVQPAFDRYWGGEAGMYSQRLGVRSSRMNAFSEMLRAGLSLAGGSDSPVTPPDPWLGISAAVIHSQPQFGLTVEQALRLFTSWAAYAGREEGVRGSIEVGKSADLCIVSQDPTAAGADELEKLEVIETWVDGEVMFRAPGV